MTGPHSETESPGTRPISVAELLARNGTIGAPAVTRRRRRRRGDSDAVTVAELTGEIPVIRDDEPDDQPGATDTVDTAAPAQPVAEPAEPVAEDEPKTPYWSEPEPRWPKSPPQPKRAPGPERSAYPRPLPEPAPSANGTGRRSSGAEDMSPDPMDHYADIPVDVMDSEVREAEPALEDSAYVRSYLQSDSALDDDLDEDLDDDHADAATLTDEDLDAAHPRTRTPRRHTRRPAGSRRSGAAVWLCCNRFWPSRSAPGCSWPSTSFGAGTASWPWCSRCWSSSAWWSGCGWCARPRTSPAR